MIDIQFVRDNPELVEKKAKEKGYNIAIQELLERDAVRRQLVGEIEQLRASRNELVSNKDARPDEASISKGKDLKQQIFRIEEKLKESEKSLHELLSAVPNPHFEDVPVGGEEENQEISRWGETHEGGKDHLDFAVERDWVDFERGAKVAGTKFYYLKGDLALLENAVVQFALQHISTKGFTLLSTPHMVNARTATGTGFAPRTSEQSDEYFVENEDLSLIATAEIPLTGYHADEIIDETKLPLLYAAYTPCYRKEAGTYGKHTRGLFRVHQFNKLEMYAFCVPEKSAEMHETILKTEEEIWQALGIPYRVVNIASRELGAPAAKKYDIEYWSKVDGAYRELTSCSNCTDFQARNLNIRMRRQDAKVEFLHTLNGTAVSMARTLVAILEHYQTDNGKLRVPDALQQYIGGRTEL